MVNPPRFVIRAPRSEDAEAIARVHVQGWREAYSQLLPSRFYDEETLRNRRDGWTRMLSRESIPQRLRIAEVDGEVIGVAFAGDVDGDSPVGDLELFLIYVVAERYGSGAGQELLDSVLGNDPARLWVARDNPRALAFYRRNGFAETGEQRIDTDANDLVELRMAR